MFPSGKHSYSKKVVIAANMALLWVRKGKEHKGKEAGWREPPHSAAFVALFVSEKI